MKSKANSGSNTLLLLLASADALLIILFILHVISKYIGFFESPWLSFGDRAFAESYTYIKEYWIVLLLITLWVRKSKSSYLIWSLLYGYLLIDDSCQVHESLGSLLRANINFISMFGRHSQALGEFCVYVAYGLLFLILISITYYKSDDDTKLDLRCFILILVLLAFFGAIVDTVRALMPYNKVIDRIMKLFENGGEMVVVSIMLWFVFCLVANDRCRLDICDALANRSSCRLMRCLGKVVCVKSQEE